jgi:hypothetical protein
VYACIPESFVNDMNLNCLAYDATKCGNWPVPETTIISMAFERPLNLSSHSGKLCTSKKNYASILVLMFKKCLLLVNATLKAMHGTLSNAVRYKYSLEVECAAHNTARSLLFP